MVPSTEDLDQTEDPWKRLRPGRHSRGGLFILSHQLPAASSLQANLSSYINPSLGITGLTMQQSHPGETTLPPFPPMPPRPPRPPPSPPPHPLVARSPNPPSPPAGVLNYDISCNLVSLTPASEGASLSISLTAMSLPPHILSCWSVMGSPFPPASHVPPLF